MYLSALFLTEAWDFGCGSADATEDCPKFSHTN